MLTQYRVRLINGEEAIKFTVEEIIQVMVKDYLENPEYCQANNGDLNLPTIREDVASLELNIPKSISVWTIIKEERRKSIIGILSKGYHNNVAKYSVMVQKSPDEVQMVYLDDFLADYIDKNIELVISEKEVVN